MYLNAAVSPICFTICTLCLALATLVEKHYISNCLIVSGNNDLSHCSSQEYCIQVHFRSLICSTYMQYKCVCCHLSLAILVTVRTLTKLKTADIVLKKPHKHSVFLANITLDISRM